MSTGWGVNAIKKTQLVNGVETIVPDGTTDVDVRQVWGALYSPGVIKGCGISTSNTAMTYVVDAGVAVIQLSGSASIPRECVMVPVPKTTLTVAPTGASSRLDRIYVQQVMTSTNNEIIVGVAQGTNIPPNSQLIRELRASANSSVSATSYSTGTTPYSVPYGANMGIFLQNTDKSNSALPKTSRVAFSGSFNIPTDRKVIFSIDASLSALRPNGSAAVGFDNSAYCEATFDVYIDDVRRFKFNTPGLSQAWGSYHFEETFNLKAGLHTVQYRTAAKGAGTPDRHYYGSDLATGITFTAKDGGFWEDLV